MVASNAAIERARRVHGGGGADPVPPTIWFPQRYPDNPGGLNFGPLYGYRQVEMGPQFYVWTFVHDISGVDRVTLYVREDGDGRDPLEDDANQTYRGGAGVGAWHAIPMRRREFPTGNPFDHPEIDVSVLPLEIADEYYVEVEGYSSVLLDYYVEAADVGGNVARSPIQHVYVGDSVGSDADPEGVHWRPQRPSRFDAITIRSPNDGLLHWGINGWHAPPASIWPDGTEPFGDDMAVDTPFGGPDAEGFYTVTLDPFAEAGVEVDSIDFVIQRADGSWDNHGGADWRIAVAADSVGAVAVRHPGRCRAQPPTKHGGRFSLNARRSSVGTSSS